MMVHVKDVEPPRAKQCPTSFVTYMGSPSDTQKSVQWSEPVFEDNVKIKHVTANFLPGHSFRAGKHNVLYTATDLDGNKAKCGFTITGKSFDLGFKPKVSHFRCLQCFGLLYSFVTTYNNCPTHHNHHHECPPNELQHHQENISPGCQQGPRDRIQFGLRQSPPGMTNQKGPTLCQEIM